MFDPTLLLSVGSTVLTAAAYLVGVYLDGRTRRVYYEAILRAETPDQLALLRDHPPRRSRFRGLPVLLVGLLIGLGLYLGATPTNTQPSALVVQEDVPTRAQPPLPRGTCRHHGDCPAGQRCESGQCVANAETGWLEGLLRRFLRSPESCPDEEIWSDRLVPRWEDRRIHVFASEHRPPD